MLYSVINLIGVCDPK